MAERSSVAAATFLTAAAMICQAATGTPSGQPGSDCHHLLSIADGGRAVGDCLYQAARARDNDKSTAAEQLESLLAVHPQLPWLHFYLGALANDLGQADAEQHLTTAAQTFTSSGNPLGAAYSHINLSRMLHAHGDRLAALDQLRRATDAAKLAATAELIGAIKVQEARLLTGHDGDLGRARRLLEEAQSIAAELTVYSLERDVLLALGEVDFSLGRYHRARLSFERLAGAAKGAEDPTAEATALLDLALVQIAERQIPADGPLAERALHRALDQAVLAGDQSTEAAARQNLGRLLGQDGSEQLHQAFDIARRLGNPLLLANSLGALASHTLIDDPEGAAARIDQILSLARSSGQPRIETYAWSDRLRVRWATLPRSAAIADSLRLLDLLEGTSDRQDETFGRANYLAVWTDAYRWIASRLLDDDPGGSPRKDDIELAFQVVEQMRGRVLRQALARQRPSTTPAEERLLRQQVAINRRLLTPLDNNQRATTEAELARVEGQLAGIRQRAEQGTERPPPPLAELSTIETSLRPDEALLSFQIGLWEDIFGHQAGGAWLMVISHAGRQLYRLPDRAVLEPAITLFRGLFKRRDGSEQRAAARLYQDLLAAALAQLPPSINRLVIVPDGILHLLPFDALRAEVEGPPLVEKYALSIVPSASLWQQWRDRPVSKRHGGALVLANPELPSAAAPATAVASERGALFKSGLALGPLPWAGHEGRAVRRLLGGHLHRGAAASESRLKSAGDEHTVLHLAAHAIIDSERSWRSAVLLAPGSDDEDGLLQPHEIHRLPLADQLVVLSACQTGAGAVLQGEGPMSLARAFFQAGAKAVVASLWPLRDDEAARLMERFASHLADGADVATALAEAKRDRRAAGAPAAAWAGMVALGDGATTPLPGGRQTYLWWWVAAALSGLLVLGEWLRRRRV